MSGSDWISGVPLGSTHWSVMDGIFALATRTKSLASLSIANGDLGYISVGLNTYINIYHCLYFTNKLRGN
jgi:hypothetical protein